MTSMTLRGAGAASHLLPLRHDEAALLEAAAASNLGLKDIELSASRPIGRAQRIKKPSPKARESEGEVTKSPCRRTAKARSPSKKKRPHLEKPSLGTKAQDQPIFTFGVELEILVHTDAEQYRPQLPKSMQSKPLEDIAQALNKAKSKYEYLIRQDISQTLQDARYAVNKVTNHMKDSDEDIAKWTVSFDPTLDASNEIAETGDKRAIVGVDLKTPCLPFTARSFKQLNHFVQLLTKKYTITSNKSCLMQVHAGKADLKTHKQIELDLKTVQNLSNLCLAFEKQFESICSDVLLADFYIRPNSEHFARQSDGVFDLQRATASIRSAKDRDAFCALFGKSMDDRYYAVNYQNLHSDARFGTVEFRQHAGCFDAQRIAMRVKLVVALIKWALQGEGLENLLWIREQAGIDLDLSTLLRLIGVEEEVVRYWDGKIVR